MKFFASTARFSVLTALLGGAWPLAATAAPFCLTNQLLPPQCIYYDAQNCQRDAQHQGSACVNNPAEFRLSAGPGQYCVVTSSQASVCGYADRGTCGQEAARQHGTCVDVPRAGAGGAPAPFSPVNGN